MHGNISDWLFTNKLYASSDLGFNLEKNKTMSVMMEFGQLRHTSVLTIHFCIENSPNIMYNKEISILKTPAQQTKILWFLKPAP